MNRKEFDSELTTYISKRRKLNPFNAIRGLFERKHTAPPKAYPEVETMEEQKTPEELATEYEAERKGFFSGLFERWFGMKEALPLEETGEEEQISNIVEQETLSNDIRTVAKIALSLSKQIPPEQLHEFKQSQDFVLFKEILRKHGLIK